MRKRQAVTAVVGVAMLLSACGQAARPTPTSTPSAPTTPAASTTTTPAQPVEFKLDPAAACQAFDSRPEPVPGIPPASPSDWSEGATTTTTVLIEYGDYQ